MLDIESVYHTYLQVKQDLNSEKYDKYKDYFSASSAGSCYRKQLHRIRGDKRTELKPRNMRLLRLGTIVHNDIEEAVNDWYDVTRPVHQRVLTEYAIVLKELNVIGHLDLCTYDENDGLVSNLEVWDYKTIGTYQWRLKYGKGAVNKIKPRYAMQVSTYGMGMMKELDTNDVVLGLLWYNKDTSTLRKEYIPDVWVDDALRYWTELNEITEDIDNPEEMQVGDVGVPFENWECKYCEYQGVYCPGLTK